MSGKRVGNWVLTSFSNLELLGCDVNPESSLSDIALFSKLLLLRRGTDEKLLSLSIEKFIYYDFALDH
jgi:hypothetical protein